MSDVGQLHVAARRCDKGPAAEDARGSEENKSTLESLNELRQALVRCEKMLDEAKES